MRARILVAATALTLTGAWPAVGAGDSISTALERCRDMSDNDERLACYDRLAGRVEAGEVKVPVVVRSKPKRPAEFTARVTEIGKRPYGELIVSLDNGETWVQKSAERIRLKVGDEVRIKRGRFGGHRLFASTRNGTEVKLVRSSD